MTIFLMGSVNDSAVEGHLFVIYQSQEVFDSAQTDDLGAY